MTEVLQPNVVIFTDGACFPNPGRGAWAAIIRVAGVPENEIWGVEPKTTNNRMEMAAAIAALEYISAPSVVTLYTDSQYLQLGMSRWLRGWKAKGRMRGEKVVKNADLWLRLDQLSTVHNIEWRWVRGHNGHPENERVDYLCRVALEMS